MAKIAWLCYCVFRRYSSKYRVLIKYEAITSGGAVPKPDLQLTGVTQQSSAVSGWPQVPHSFQINSNWSCKLHARPHNTTCYKQLIVNKLFGKSLGHEVFSADTHF